VTALAAIVLAMTELTPAAVGAGAPAARVQLGFYHFNGNQVTITFEGKRILSKVVPAPPKGDRSGISDFTWVSLARCGDLAVMVGRSKTVRRVCPGEGDKSVRIDAGPPLVVTVLKVHHGAD